MLFIQAMAPMLAALLAWVALREPVSTRDRRRDGGRVGRRRDHGRRTGRRAACSATGCRSLMALSFAVSIVISRHRRDISMLLASASRSSSSRRVRAVRPCRARRRKDVIALAALGAGQIGLGLAFLTVGARLIPAAQVALITLLEVVLGPLWVWLAHRREADDRDALGGAIVVLAVVIQAVGPSARSAAPAADAVGPVR